VITVLCTNRLGALDPAVRRRAFDEFEFTRPNLEQRVALLTRIFDGTGLDTAQIAKLAAITGENGERSFGFTYSDLTTRLASAVLLDALPASPLRFKRVATIVEDLRATPPFGAAGR
jgi:AAA+ superfamily predicted ATPase